jgi:CheY-like chemotaxis protein
MPTVLIIDAEEDFANQLADALREEGIEPVVTGDGKVGLDLARINVPSAIVLCVELPRMSGYSICAKLKKDTALKSVPLIITSAEATPETFEHHKKLKTRAEEYLKKPFAAGQLVRVLRQYVQFPEGGVALPEEDAAIAEELSMEDAAPAVLSDDEVFSDEEASSMVRSGGASSSEMSQIDEMLSDLSRPPARVPAPRNPTLRGEEPELEEEDEIMTTVGFVPQTATAPLPDNTRELALEHELQEARAQLQAAKDAQAKAEREKASAERAQQAAERAATSASQLPTGASSSAREVSLKKELNQKQHELLELQDKLHQKEREALAFQDRETDLEGQIVALEEERNAALAGQSAAEQLAGEADDQRAGAEAMMRQAEQRAKEQETRALASDQKATAAEQKASAAERKATLAEARAREAEQKATSAEQRAQSAEERAQSAEDAHTQLELESSGTIEDLNRRLGEASSHEAELDAALTTMTAEASALRETVADHEQALSSAQEHITTLRAANQSQAQDITRLTNQLGAANAESDSLRQQNASAQRTIEDGLMRASSLEGDLASVRGELEAARMMITELEGEREVAEGRIARAYQRIRDDEKIKGKAKKAMEIALALLQEAGYSPDAEAPALEGTSDTIDQARS